MKLIQDFIGQELRWIHPRFFSRIDELRFGEEILARINWQGGFGHKAIVETAEHSWEFKQIGMLGSTIAILLPGNETPIATIRRGISGRGTVEFFDGQRYLWKSTSFWRGTWCWQTNEGLPLLQISRKQVTIEATAHGLQNLSLLILLGFYLIKISEEETATAAAVV